MAVVHVAVAVQGWGAVDRGMAVARLCRDMVVQGVVLYPDFLALLTGLLERPQACPCQAATASLQPALSTMQDQADRRGPLAAGPWEYPGQAGQGPQGLLEGG